MNLQNIADLGRLMAERMLAPAYEHSHFSRVAAAALVEAAIETPFDLVEIAELAVPCAPGTSEARSVDADLLVPLYVQDDFAIELAVFRSGPPRVRGYGWTGAIQLLFGVAVRTTYRFEQVRRVNDRVRTGSVVPGACELLGAGDIREVQGDSSAALEALFPMEAPAGALIISTRARAGGVARFTHYPPMLAVATDAAEDRLVCEARRCTDLAANLADDDLFMATVAASFTELDRFRGLYCALSTQVRGAVRRARYSAEVPRCFGELEDEVRQALVHAWSLDDLAAVREQLEGAELRFLLGAFLAAPSVDALRDLVAQQHGVVDPMDALVRLLCRHIEDEKLSITWDPEAPEDALLRSYLAGESIDDAMAGDASQPPGPGRRAAVEEAFTLMGEDPVLCAIRPIAAEFVARR